MNELLNEIRRKLGFHMLGGLAIAFIFYLIPKFIFQICIIILLIIALIMRSMKLHNMNSKLIENMSKTFGRKNEDGNGSIYMFLGIILVSILFTKNIAILSIIVLSISDSISTLIGKFLGKIKIYKKKTLEGTLSFFVSGFLIIFLSTQNFIISFFASITSALIELFTPIDDNLIIPSSCAFVIAILMLIM